MAKITLLAIVIVAAGVGVLFVLLNMLESDKQIDLVSDEVKFTVCSAAEKYEGTVLECSNTLGEPYFRAKPSQGFTTASDSVYSTTGTLIVKCGGLQEPIKTEANDPECKHYPGTDNCVNVTSRCN